MSLSGLFMTGHKDGSAAGGSAVEAGGSGILAEGYRMTVSGRE